MSKFIVILLFLGWTAGGTYYYTCQIKGLCEPEPKEVSSAEPKTEEPKKIPSLNSNFGFGLNSSEAKFGSGWKLLKDSLVHLVSTDDNQLLIVGKYFSGEAAPAGFRNMGLARAQFIKNELADSLTENRISVSSEFMGDRPSNYWDSSAEFITEKLDNTQAQVVENQQGITIYFPSGSADALMSESLMGKLKRISKELVATDGGANIVGHTDNTGDGKANHVLGKKRADMVKSLFVENGVKEENLRASSMGDTQPTADNSTAEGRALNRRIEVTFNDN